MPAGLRHSVLLSESTMSGKPNWRPRRRDRRTTNSFDSVQSRDHSAHIGQDVVIHYRWHPLYGRKARRIQVERRASGEFVHVELTPASITILPAWKVDPVYCSGLKVGTPQVSLSELCELHELLIACESRLVSSGGNAVTQETHDGIAGTADTNDGACSEGASRELDGPA